MKQKILDAAVKLADRHGFRKVSKEKIAKEVGCPVGSINYYWGTVFKLDHAVMKHAVSTKNVRIVARGLATRHPVALRAPFALRQQAAKILVT
jgi:AcrR family transcriptional regulator